MQTDIQVLEQHIQQMRPRIVKLHQNRMGQDSLQNLQHLFFSGLGHLQTAGKRERRLAVGGHEHATFFESCVSATTLKLIITIII